MNCLSEILSSKQVCAARRTRDKMPAMGIQQLVKTFSTRIEADIAKAFLESEGIPSSIQADDQGGMRPHLALTGGVKLFVATEQAELAAQLLSALPLDPQ